MDVQQQLFGLMAVAEEHQKAVNAALDGLTAERAALAKERAAVVQAAASLAGVASEVRQAAGEAGPILQKALGEAVGASRWSDGIFWGSGLDPLKEIQRSISYALPLLRIRAVCQARL